MLVINNQCVNKQFELSVRQILNISKTELIQLTFMHIDHKMF